MEKRKPVDQKQRKAAEQAALMEARGQGRDDAAQGAQPYYRSQREVDAAFARRLAAARRKWSRDAGAQGPAQAAPEAAVPDMEEPAGGEGAYAPVQSGGPASAGMGQMPGQFGQAAMPGIAPGMLPAGAAGGMPGMPAAPSQEEPTAGGMDAPGDEASQIATRLLAEEADIQQVYPDFALESFIASDERIRDALLAGRSLWSVFTAVYGGILRQQAETDAVERIRSRNSAVPDVLRAGGTAGAVAPDYANMPSDQFSRLRKEYETQMRLGKKVKP